MNQLPVILLSSILSATLAGTAVYLLKGDTQPGSADGAPSEAPLPGTADPKLQELDQQLTQLRDELNTLRNSPARSTTRQVAAFDRAQLESLVAEILAGQKTQDAASRGESSAVEAAAFDIQAAIDQLSTAELGYDAREALFKKAKTAGQLGELIERLKARSEANPAIAEPHLELGQAYLTLLEGMPPSEESGRIAMAADRSFDRALEADGEHWEARFLKGMSLSFWPPVFGKQKIAIEQFETLRQQQVKSAPEPHHVQTYVYLGNLYSQQGKTEEARKVWEEGLRRHPGNEELKSRLR